MNQCKREKANIERKKKKIQRETEREKERETKIKEEKSSTIVHLHMYRHPIKKKYFHYEPIFVMEEAHEEPRVWMDPQRKSVFVKVAGRYTQNNDEPEPNV